MTPAFRYRPILRWTNFDATHMNFLLATRGMRAMRNLARLAVLRQAIYRCRDAVQLCCFAGLRGLPSALDLRGAGPRFFMGFKGGASPSLLISS